MTRLKSFANLTQCDLHAQTPQLQLAVQQFAARKSPRPLDLFNTRQYERWAGALRANVDDGVVCAEQHRDAQLITIAMQRARAKRSH